MELEIKDMSLCLSDGCVRKRRSKGACAEHYHVMHPDDTHKLCTFSGCSRLKNVRGLCAGHAGQQRKGEELQPLQSHIRVTVIPHGTSGGYSNHGCRCEDCRRAWNLYSVQYKARRALVTPRLPTNQGKNAASNELSRIKKTLDIPKLKAEQGHKCALCARGDRPLVIDHIHGTLHVRGLLCISCNTGLGKLGDSPEGLRRALRYLVDNTP